MAFKRNWLAAMGIESDKIEEIIAAHVEVVNALKDERDQLQADNEKLKGVQQQLDDLQNGDNDWQSKYENEHQAFEDFKKTVAEADTKRVKEQKYHDALVKIGIPEKIASSILRIADLSGVELVDGEVKDAEAFEKSVSETWADYIPKQGERRNDPDNPPDAKPTGKEAFDAMSLSEQMQYANAHPEEVAAYMK